MVFIGKYYHGEHREHREEEGEKSGNSSRRILSRNCIFSVSSVISVVEILAVCCCSYAKLIASDLETFDSIFEQL